jgi:hypothetical protein
MRKVVPMILLVAFALSLCCSPAWADAKKEQAAVDAAKAWLALIDQGKYAESWDSAATIFRNAVEKDKWKQQLDAVRTPLGKIVSRKLKTKKYMTSVPGAPDGEYVLIQFDTSFDKKKAAVETITPMIDKDGKWHVSGYFVK